MTPPHARSRQITPASRFAAGWRERISVAATASPRDSSCGVSRGDVVLVVVAHPDDETLAMGGTLADLSAGGVAVHVVSMSSGEAALDGVGVSVPELGRLRRDELSAAAGRLGLQSTTVLDLPDGRLAEHAEELVTVVDSLVEQHGADCLLTLWRHDPHPDHQAVAAAAREISTQRSIGLVEFALWALHWTDPTSAPDQPRHVVETSADGQRARVAAIGEYRTQIDPLAADLEAILPAEVLDWSHECVMSS